MISTCMNTLLTQCSSLTVNQLIQLNLFISFTASSFSSEVQILSVCTIPKRGLNVMQGEVNRVLLLSKHAILPLSYIVPRKVQSFLSLIFTRLFIMFIQNVHFIMSMCNIVPICVAPGIFCF